MSTKWAFRSFGLRAGRRGLSAVVSAIVIVVLLALMGVATYGVLGGFSGSNNPTTCWPPTAFVCGKFVNHHDVTLVLPFKSIQQGASVPFTVQLPPSESASSFTINFGDGAIVTGQSSTLSHNYSSPGVYLVEAEATVNGQVHDNVPALTLVTVTPSFGSSTAGNLPGVRAALVANSTSPAGTKGITAVLQPFQSVTVSGTYTSSPTNPAFTPGAPSFNVSGGTISGQNLTAGGGTATAVFDTPGIHSITFVASASNGTATLVQNFTWTVFVAATGEHAGVAGTQPRVSPHPGTIINYELAPGGALSEDPAIDYETVGAEPIYNVYQTLINYNGSLTGPTWDNFVPQLATCVPGSPQCQKLYSSTLVDGWNYTFVIQPNASFYDGATGASWGVWPTDVVFSLARTMGFSTLPCTECNNGWIIAQSLLDGGNYTWDSIHGAYNNTPQQILNSMTINGTDCPSAAMNDPSQAHGCVTFHVYGGHHIWPYFLELIADPLGGSVVSCGWFSASQQGAGIPYWTSGNSSGAGDHPCGQQGTPGWGSPTIPFTGWDQWEQLGSGAFGTFQGHVQYAMLGSGPYYMSQYAVAISYTLQANPAYKQNPFCTWTGCQPAAGNYAKTVEVTWETQATPGEQAYAAGIADHASVPEPDLGLLLQLVGQGRVNMISAPDLTIGFSPFNMNFNVQGAQKFTTNPISVPTDWFSYMGMRQLFARAYPYTTVQQTIQTRDGIQFGFLYGGAIPQFMAQYYPRDIPWPNSDPCMDPSQVACPSYWWANMHNPASPYYDSEVLSCTSGNPCQLPMFGTTGNPTGDQIMSLWAGEISTITSGAVKITPVDINFVDVLINSEFSGPGQNPMPIYQLGWAPDYPDPTDYVAPLYSANSTYTYGDSVMQSLMVPQFTGGCAGSITDYNYFANTTFGNNCQGQAYKAMLYLLGIAAVTPPGAERILQYDLAEKIAYQLGLYVYTGQGNEVTGYASWIDTASINTNVTIGGAGDVPYFWLTGNGVQFAGSS